jgi:hypothetical protein
MLHALLSLFALLHVIVRCALADSSEEHAWVEAELLLQGCAIRRDGIWQQGDTDLARVSEAFFELALLRHDQIAINRSLFTHRASAREFRREIREATADESLESSEKLGVALP